MPCSAISNPSISSSLVTLNPIDFFNIEKNIKANAAAQKVYAKAPIN